jgi:hypothetical protein
MFDGVRIVDLGSTDGSAGIIASLAPSHWELHPPKPGDSIENIAAQAEAAAPAGAWRITLEPFDFIVFSDLRAVAAEADAKRVVAVGADGDAGPLPLAALRLPSFTMECGGAPTQLRKVASPLLTCTRYLVEARQGGALRAGLGASSRLLHAVPGLQYAAGRMNSMGGETEPMLLEASGFIARFAEPGDGDGALVAEDLRVIALAPAGSEGFTSAMRGAHTAWHAVFGHESPIKFK